jgi:hypothetical protein
MDGMNGSNGNVKAAAGEGSAGTDSRGAAEGGLQKLPLQRRLGLLRAREMASLQRLA